MTKDDFVSTIQAGYSFKGDAVLLGAAMRDGQVFAEAPIRLPLRTMNRHGLISGATGTGKTKTLQMISEQLSEAGVPTLLMDIKGDLSGLGHAGRRLRPALPIAMRRSAREWSPSAYPVEFLTLSDEPGARLRATVLEFGPLLFSRMLGLNETQSSLVALVYKFCDDKHLPLLDLKDFKKVLEYITGDAKPNVTAEYGLVPTTSTALILRKLIELGAAGGRTVLRRALVRSSGSPARRRRFRCDLDSAPERHAESPETFLILHAPTARRALRHAPGSRRHGQTEARALHRRSASDFR